MSAVGALVVSSMREMRRDRSAVFFLAVLPVALMVLMGNIYAAEDGAVPTVAVVVESADVGGEAVLATLRSSGSVELVDVGDRSGLDDAVRRRRVDAGIVLAAGQPVVLVGPPDVQIPGGVRFVVAGAVRRADQAVWLAERTGEPVDAVLDALPAPVSPPAEDPGEARTEAAIGVLVLVTFMNLIAYSSLVPAHRDLGVLSRLAVVPAGRRIVTAGYAVTFVAIAGVQIAVSLLAGATLVDISWGEPVQVLAIAVGLAVAAGGVGTLSATLLPSPESGSTLGGPIGFALGMLGGCLWPLSFVGGVLESIGRWVPHQWAVAALRRVADGGVSNTSLGGAVAALVAVGLVAAAIGSRRLASSWG